jgi:hypothetical protein
MSIVAIPLVAVLVRAIGSRTSVLKSVALLTILPGRKAPTIVSLALRLVSRPVGERLWGVRRSGRLRLKSWLRLLVSGLPLRGRSETIRQRVEIAVILQVILILAGRALLTALCERLCSLRSGNKPEVMLRVLQIIFRRDRIAARMSVSRELKVFFRHVMRIAAYFHVWSVRFIGSRQRIGPSPIICRPAAHPLILTWSHFGFPISIRLAQCFRSFSVEAFSIFRVRDDSRLRAFEWADLVTPDARTRPIALISIPCEFPFTSGAPHAAFGPSSMSGRPLQAASPNPVPCLGNPSRDQIVRVGSGRKAKAGKFVLPANPLQPE